METWGFYFLGMLAYALGVKLYEWGYNAGRRDEMQDWIDWMKRSDNAESLHFNTISC